MNVLQAYGSDDEEPQQQTTTTEEATEEFDETDAFALKRIKTGKTRGAGSDLPATFASSAPDVLDKDLMKAGLSMIARPEDTQVNVNLRYEDQLLPVQGPKNAFEERTIDKMNTLTGFVEDHAMASADFKHQQRSYYVNGYAMNPSLLGPVDESGSLLQPYIGPNQELAARNKGAILADLRPTRASIKAQKRKRKAKGQLGEFDEPDEEDQAVGEDIEGAPVAPPKKQKEYIGPWAAWEEEAVAKDDGPEFEEVEEHFRKQKPVIERSKREIGFGEEKSVFHGKSMLDYQGRTYMSVPRDVGVDLEPDEPGGQQCFIPKKCIHTWSGHTRGVSAIKLFPKSGHLLLSASMDNRVKLWDIYHDGKCLRTFMGHSKAVRDVSFNYDGTRFVSAGFDRQMKLWDTETGQCLQAFSNQQLPYCVQFHPDPAKGNIFLTGMHDKKIIQWDSNSGEITQEYDQHLGPVNTITFTDEGRRFVTTSDDKSIRAWDFDIPVVIKYIAEPTMHSMPAVAASPNDKWLAMQSLDNQILIYSAETFKQNRRKGYRGHTVAGYACVPAFSPDGRFISSGDSAGNVNFWDFKTGRKYPNKLEAHQRVCIDQKWLPHETSKLVTASWDNTIKLWD